MSETPMTVTFPVAFNGRRPAPKAKPDPLVTAERLRQNRAARRARTLALAYHIDSLIRSGEVTDLATTARICNVSRARVSKVVGLLGLDSAEQERILTAVVNGSASSDL